MTLSRFNLLVSQPL